MSITNAINLEQLRLRMITKKSSVTSYAYEEEPVPYLEYSQFFSKLFSFVSLCFHCPVNLTILIRNF